MTPTDRNNLKFLVEASVDEIRAWFNNLDPSEYEYALPLLDRAQAILLIFIAHEKAETVLNTNSNEFPQAAKLLKRFML